MPSLAAPEFRSFATLNAGAQGLAACLSLVMNTQSALQNGLMPAYKWHTVAVSISKGRACLHHQTCVLVQLVQTNANGRLCRPAAWTSLLKVLLAVPQNLRAIRQPCGQEGRRLHTALQRMLMSHRPCLRGISRRGDAVQCLYCGHNSQATRMPAWAFISAIQVHDCKAM